MSTITSQQTATSRQIITNKPQRSNPQTIQSNSTQITSKSHRKAKHRQTQTKHITHQSNQNHQHQPATQVKITNQTTNNTQAEHTKTNRHHATTQTVNQTA